MPEFNRPYTYGNGRFVYIIYLNAGDVSVHEFNTGSKMLSAEAVRYHLQEVKQAHDFRYTDGE